VTSFLNSVNKLIFVMVTDSVIFDVRAEFLNNDVFTGDSDSKS
jgi:hypothetical protein